MTEKNKSISRKDFRKRNRRSFLLSGFSLFCGAFGLSWLLTAEKNNNTISSPLRKGLLANENFWSRIFNPSPKNTPASVPLPGTLTRVNGDIGLDEDIDLNAWVLEYESPTLKKTFTLQELQSFPRASSLAEFRCIEGWSMPISYEGLRFSDFLAAFDSAAMKFPYVGLETPEADYYVGLDMESMLHSQTLLADTMNSAPLGKEHGEPLRLIIPVKYGIKSLKRIGRIIISENRPRDYWAENGYDWYSGL